MNRSICAILVAVALCLNTGCRPTKKLRVPVVTESVPFQIGESAIHARVTTNGKASMLMVHLHENERASAEAGRALVQKQGGRLVELVHSEQRRISFVLDGRTYSFDPNRIFSGNGIRETLRGPMPIPREAYAEVSKFAESFVRRFSLDREPVLLALHNNTEGALSIHSYAPGADYSAEAAQYSVEPSADPDNFYFVTDPHYYIALRDRRFNAVLQNNRIAYEDGSLSVFAARHGIPYINVEAQHDFVDEQLEMVRVAVEVIARGGVLSDTRGVARRNP